MAGTPNEDPADLPEIRSKADSQVMYWLATLLKPVCPTFLTAYWTTWFGVIYAPTTVNISSRPELQYYLPTIAHERQHVYDQRQYHVWFYLTYLLSPLPIFFAYGRWFWERRAHLAELKVTAKEDRQAVVDEALSELASSNYLWCWPKSLMKSWFQDQLKTLP